VKLFLAELENNPLYDNTEIIWQQDGAPPHYSLRVREFLNNSFPEWIGRRGTVYSSPIISSHAMRFFGVGHNEE
jgi:hypothetical protein